MQEMLINYRGIQGIQSDLLLASQGKPYRPDQIQIKKKITQNKIPKKFSFVFEKEIKILPKQIKPGRLCLYQTCLPNVAKRCTTENKNSTTKAKGIHGEHLNKIIKES